MEILLDIPERYLTGSTPAEFAGWLKLYDALPLFQSGELSAGAACKLACADRFSFLAACNRHGIPVIDYSPEELRDEVKALRSDPRG
ncbi:MAG: UPF0175 family protein [Nitrococcus sp.]|nr:UPF0175 family protein [Nitrococcus sp.]